MDLFKIFTRKNGRQLEKTPFLGHVSARQTPKIGCRVIAGTFWSYWQQKILDQSASSTRNNQLFVLYENHENAMSILDTPSEKWL